jgi:hypothetical protein
LGIGMNSIPWLADMNDLSGAEMSLVGLIAIVASLATGFVIDVIAQRAAFGTFINAVLALAGACGGIYLRYHWLGSSRIDDIDDQLGLGGRFRPDLHARLSPKSRPLIRSRLAPSCGMLAHPGFERALAIRRSPRSLAPDDKFCNAALQQRRDEGE